MACSAAIAAAQGPTTIDRTLENQRLNDLALWNLGGDKIYEIFVTSVSGNTGCYSAATLEPLWEKQISNEVLTAPVLGDFMNTGAPVLAFGSASGQVYFVWPGTGEIISTIRSGLSFSLSPSVAETKHGDMLVLADEQGQIAIFDLEPATGLPRMRCLIPNTLSSSTAFSVIGGITQPPSCADLNGDGAPEIVVSSDSGVLEIVSLSATDSPIQVPKKYYTRLAQNSRATTLAGLGSLSQPGQNLIILGVDASLQLFKWQPDAAMDKAIVPFLQTPAFGSSLGHLLIGPANTDDVPDLVSTANGAIAARYLGVDFSSQNALIDISSQHLTSTATPFSPAVPITLRDGSPAILSIDNEGVAWKWQPNSQIDAQVRLAEVPVPTAFTPAGDLTGNGKLTMIIWNEKSFTLTAVNLLIDVASSDSPGAGSGPALTLGINYSRNGQWGPEWAADWQRRLAASAAALKQAKAGASSDNTELTTDSVSTIAGLDPNDPAAARLQKNTRGIPTTYLVAGVAALLILAGGGVWMLRRKR